VTKWRLAVAAVLAALVAAPLCLPAGQLLTEPDAWRAWSDGPRLLSLAGNTLLLVCGTLALCLPAGVAGAVLLYRTDQPLRRTLRSLVLLTLFVPLPLFTSGWQSAVGGGGWLPLRWWNKPRPEDTAFASGGTVWTPWGQGIGTAVWVHAAAGLPWVVWLVGRGLRRVDRELEEDALTAARPWRVLVRVSLPRASASIAVAALWVALQSATEITVTDVMQVRTFAEEVYTQFVLSDRGSLERAVAVSLPLTLFVAVLVLITAWHWERSLPPSLTHAGLPPVFRLGRWRWPAGLATAAAAAVLVGIPVGSLVWRAGLSGTPPAWSAAVMLRYMHAALKSSATWSGEFRVDRFDVSLLVAFAAGAVAATLALLACWASRESRGFRAAVLVLMAVAWATPGPVVGLGLNAVIGWLLDRTESDALKALLWNGPSAAPVLWVAVVRFFPCAVAVLWPALQTLPAELREAARVEGAGPIREFIAVVVPLTAGVWLLAALAAGVLALGEVSAGKLVATPGGDTWSHHVFTQMHYGVTNDLAARCLLLLVVIVVAGAAIGWLARGREEHRD
jgi:iron(III) transport system permease protein